MFAKNYHLHWTVAEKIFSVNIWYTYFSIFGVAFIVPFYIISKTSSFLFQKSFELIFAALHFYIYQLKKCVSDFKT